MLVQCVLGVAAFLMITLILSNAGLSRMQLSRVVACCDVLFFEQHRFGSKLRPPFQASAISRSKTNTGISSASAEKKKKKKKNLFHFIKKKVLRRKSINGSVKPSEITEDAMSKCAKGGAAAAAAAAKPKVFANPEQLGTCMASACDGYEPKRSCMPVWLMSSVTYVFLNSLVSDLPSGQAAVHRPGFDRLWRHVRTITDQSGR